MPKHSSETTVTKIDPIDDCAVTKKRMYRFKLSLFFFPCFNGGGKKKESYVIASGQTACIPSPTLCNFKYLSSYNIPEKHGLQYKHHRHTVQNI